MINNCEFPSQVPLREEAVFHIKVNYFNDHYWHRKKNPLRSKEYTSLFEMKPKSKSRQNSILLILYTWILMTSFKNMTKFVVRSLFKLIQYYWKFHLQCHCKGLCRFQNALNLTQHYTCHLEFTKLFELTTWVAASCSTPIYLMGPYQMPIKNNPNFCIVS